MTAGCSRESSLEGIGQEIDEPLSARLTVSLSVNYANTHRTSQCPSKLKLRVLKHISCKVDAYLLSETAKRFSSSTCSDVWYAEFDRILGPNIVLVSTVRPFWRACGLQTSRGASGPRAERARVYALPTASDAPSRYALYLLVL